MVVITLRDLQIESIRTIDIVYPKKNANEKKDEIEKKDENAEKKLANKYENVSARETPKRIK